MDQFLPLKTIPAFLWQNTPPLPRELSDDYQARVRCLDEHPHFFNGPVAISRGLNGGGLSVAPANYALAGLISDGLLPDWSVLAVRAVIVNSLGQMLWPRRGTATAFADYWEPGAGGAIDQANPERAIKAELFEELAIDSDALPEGALRFEGLGYSPHSIRLIWSVQANQFEANPAEVSEAIWLAPPEQPYPVLPHYGPKLLKSLQEIVSRR